MPQEKKLTKRTAVLLSIAIALIGLGIKPDIVVEAFRLMDPAAVEEYFDGGVVVEPADDLPSRYEEFVASREVHLYADMSSQDIDAAMGEDPTGVRAVVHGSIAPIYIGGGKPYSITGPDGTAAHDILFVGADDTATIRGVKFGTSAGGVSGEIRFSGLTMTPSTDGDFAPLRTLDHMIDMHLILEDIRLETFDDWKAFGGFGMKWGALINGCKLTVIGLVADPAREHTFYIKNCWDVWIQDARNTTRMFTDAAGVERELGNGRTFEQHSNRVPNDFPKGGAPSKGVFVFKNCVGVMCGWEGMLAWADAEGEVHAGGKAAGGSTFTVHGHTGSLVRYIDCEALDPYCGGLAIWNEVGSNTKSNANVLGLRGWMFDLEGELFNPLESTELDGWCTDRIEVQGYRQNSVGSRTPLLLAGVREVSLVDLMIAGEPVADGSEHIKINHQKGVTPIELMEIQ